MHVGIAYLRWRGKRSRHSRRMRTRNFAYLARGPLMMVIVYNQILVFVFLNIVISKSRYSASVLAEAMILSTKAPGHPTSLLLIVMGLQCNMDHNTHHVAIIEPTMFAVSRDAEKTDFVVDGGMVGILYGWWGNNTAEDTGIQSTQYNDGLYQELGKRRIY